MNEHRFKRTVFDEKKALKKALKAVEKPDTNGGLNYRVSVLENLHGIETVVPEKPKKA